MSDTLLNAVEALKTQANSQIESLKALPEMVELIKLVSALNTLEGLCGIEKTSLASFFGTELGSGGENIRTIVKVGEFFGKAPLDAAKLYLKKKNKPASFDEILENLARGSCDVPKKSDLKVSLARSTFEIARLGDDNFGLLDWYPEEKAKRQSRKKSNNEITVSEDNGSSGESTEGQGAES
jgi:hypothetical protein